MKAIRITETGGPEVMHLEEIETPVPQKDEVLIKVVYDAVYPGQGSAVPAQPV